MVPTRSRRPLLMTAAAVALVLIGAGCHTGAATPYEFHEDTRVLVLAPQSDESLAVAERPDYEPGSDDEVAVASSPAGGLSRTLSVWQGEPEVATLSFTSAPLETTRYVDLEEPVVGQLFITNTVRPAAVDSIRIITELYVDDEFAGGAYYEHTPASSKEPWNPVPIHFRPEIDVLPAGAELEVRVTAHAGLLDVVLGTGGDHASHIDVPFYPFDPLAGAVFLEDGKLVSAVADDDTTGEESFAMAISFMESPEFDDLPPGHYVVRGGSVEDAGGFGGVHLATALALPLVLLGTIGRLPPRRPAVAVLLVAAFAFAGCAGAGDEGPEGPVAPGQPEPGIKTTFEETDEETAEKQKEAQVGSVRGVVKNYFGIPIQSAHISIMGTNKFTRSDADGRFSIQDVPVGKYQVRVDAEQWASIEREIEVRIAKVSTLSVVMVPPEGARADQIQHLHDEWRGQDKLLLEQVEIEPKFHLHTQHLEGLDGACMYSYWFQTTDSNSGYGTSSTDNQCTEPVPFDFENRVLPGTAMIEFELDWDDSGSNIPALGLVYTNNLRDSAGHNAHLARGPGEPFKIHIFPNQADPGHQSFSNWQFAIVAPGSDGYSGLPHDRPYDMPDITVKATIHKGIVPFEPKHEDRWGEETTRFVLADGTKRSTFASLYTFGGTTAGSATLHEEKDGWISYETTTGATQWTPLRGSWVPAGTDRIEGKLIPDPYKAHASAPPLPAPHVEYTIGYRPASIPPGQALGNLRIVEDMEETEDGYKFTIVPDEDDLDKWYQTSTQWRFYLLARSDVHTYNYGHGFYLEAEAIKDPTWEFEDTL